MIQIQLYKNRTMRKNRSKIAKVHKNVGQYLNHMKIGIYNDGVWFKMLEGQTSQNVGQIHVHTPGYGVKTTLRILDVIQWHR